MKSLRIGCLTWFNGTLASQTGEAITEYTFVGEVSKELRQSVCFTVDKQWQLAIPTEKGPHVWTSSDGHDWKSIGLPSIHQPKMAHVVLEAGSEQAAIIEPDWLHIWDKNRWKSEPLPKGADWAGADMNGNWWAVGSQPSSKNKMEEHEVAAWFLEQLGSEWEPIDIRPASWWQSIKVVGGGGFYSLSAINAKGTPLILASECAWFVEDPSWFIFTQESNGRFTIQKLPRLGISSIERHHDGTPFIITTDGDIWERKRGQWKPYGLAQSLSNYLQHHTHSEDITVSLAVKDEHVAAIATIWESGQHTEQFFLKSNTKGKDWSLVFKAKENQHLIAPYIF